jgi:hypothetical protein
MSDRYEIKAWRMSSNDKAYTVRIGSAWVDKNGITRLAFDALPIPDKDGRVTCFLEVPRERDGAERAPEPSRASPAGNSYAAATQGRATQRGGSAARLEDDIPFAMEWR